jgi:uncharacterized membrane protein
LKLTTRLRVIIVAAIFFIGLAFTFYYYPLLPERIPVHFGESGAPNGWGPQKMTIIIYSSVQTVIVVAYFLILALVSNVNSALSGFQRKRQGITVEDQKRINAIGISILDWTMIWVMILVVYLQAQSISVALGRSQVFGGAPKVIIAVIFGGVAFFVVRLFREQIRLVRESKKRQGS